MQSFTVIKLQKLERYKHLINSSTEPSLMVPSLWKEKKKIPRKKIITERKLKTNPYSPAAVQETQEPWKLFFWSFLYKKVKILVLL
jgi:hypothetical protein